MFHTIYDKYKEKCEILTGIPKPRRGILHAAEDKTKWVRRLLSKDIVMNICFKEEKKNLCTGPDCILTSLRFRNDTAFASLFRERPGFFHNAPVAERDARKLRDRSDDPRDGIGDVDGLQRLILREDRVDPHDAK